MANDNKSKPAFGFLAFCDHIWQRMGHEGSMSNADWHGLSFEERSQAIAIWGMTHQSLPESNDHWDSIYPAVVNLPEEAARPDRSDKTTEEPQDA